MDILSKIRRTIVESGSVYKAKDLFTYLVTENETPEIDNPEFYDVSTKELKLGSLCSVELKKGLTPDIEVEGSTYTTYCALL